jgi:hypothetical protein
MGDLTEKLGRMAERTRRRGTSELREGLRQLANLIADALGNFEELAIDRVAKRECTKQAIRGAALLDACDVIEREVLADARTRDFKLPASSTMDALQRVVDEKVRPFCGEGGFTYVVWARNPDEYNYVGMSKNRDGGAVRLRLDGRGKLLASLQESTVLSVIVPRREPRPIASDVEAAILAILDENNAFPRRNDRSQKVPSAAGSAHLRRVGELLTNLGAQFRPDGAMVARVLSRS